MAILNRTLQNDVVPVASFNSAARVGMHSPIEHKDDLDSNGHEKSIDERSFSDFGIDGSEKDWRQDANESTGSSSYNGKKKQNNTLDDLRDAIEVADEMQEARQEQMMRFSYKNGIYNIDGLKFSQEALNETKKSIKDDPQAFGEKHNLNEEQVDASLAYIAAMEEYRDDPVKMKEANDFYKTQHPEAWSAARDELEKNENNRDNTNNQSKEAASKLTDDNSDLIVTAKEDLKVASYATEGKRLSGDNTETIKEIAEVKLDTNEDYGDMFEMEDNSLATTSFAQRAEPEKTAQISIAGDFTEATQYSNTIEIPPISNEMGNNKNFDFGNSLT